jgi:phosphoribosylformylglycinamidine synthase subunit PurQ / glutaminase
MKLGVVVFPGSNCERDMVDAARLYLQEDVALLWHDQEADLTGFDAVLLPGGFSYGDYLRSGALARFSPVMRAVKAFADRGGPVLGVCNGFQILTEAGLLPGALMRNASMQFQCQQVDLIVENNRTPFSQAYSTQQAIRLPIAHADGNYYAPPELLARLEENGQVVLRYVEDVNGSLNRIAGICNEKGNVVGMMPHPERNLWPDVLGSTWNGEGQGVFESLVKTYSKPD